MVEINGFDVPDYVERLKEHEGDLIRFKGYGADGWRIEIVGIVKIAEKVDEESYYIVDGDRRELVFWRKKRAGTALYSGMRN